MNKKKAAAWVTKTLGQLVETLENAMDVVGEGPFPDYMELSFEHEGRSVSLSVNFNISETSAKIE